MLKEHKKLEILGRNLARVRKLRKLSQNELAEIVGVSREHLAKVETAKRGISINLLFRLSDALEIRESALLDFERDNTIIR